MQEENDNLKCELDEKQLQVDNGQNQICQYEDQLKVLDEIQKQRDDLQQMVQKERIKRQELSEQIKMIETEAAELRIRDESDYKKREEEIRRLLEDKNETQQASSDKDIKIKNLMKTNLDLQSQLSQLNELITIKDDLSDQIQQLGNFIDEL